MLGRGRRVRGGWSWRRVAALLVVALGYFAVVAFIVEGLGVTSRWEVRLILGALAIPGVFVGALPELLRPASPGRRKRKRSWRRDEPPSDLSGR